jgi:hypothetical protein
LRLVRGVAVVVVVARRSVVKRALNMEEDDILFWVSVELLREVGIEVYWADGIGFRR